MNTNIYKKIGVLGMGPQATADYFLRVIRLFQKKLKAKCDSDFPEFIINSIPLAYREELNIINEEAMIVVRGCKLLELAGADFITIACNTVHRHIVEMRSSVKIPIISIIEETVRQISLNKVENVLIMGSKVTRDSKIYNMELDKSGIKYTLLNDEDEDIITNVVLNVVRGIHGEKDTNDLIMIINKYPNVGGVILGCTELPIVLKAEDTPIPVFDTLDILAESAFKVSTNQVDCVEKR